MTPWLNQWNFDFGTRAFLEKLFKSQKGRPHPQFKKDEQYRLYKVFKERELKSGTSNTATTKISGGGQLRSSSPLADESVDENSSQAPSAGASASGTRPNPEAEGVAKSLSSMLDSMCPLDKKGKNKENDSDTEDEDDEAQGKKPKKRKGKGRSTQQPRERTEDPQVQLYASQPFTLSATCLHYSHIIFVFLSLSLSLPLSLSSLSLSLSRSLPPSIQGLLECTCVRGRSQEKRASIFEQNHQRASAQVTLVGFLLVLGPRPSHAFFYILRYVPSEAEKPWEESSHCGQRPS
ncbi:unnamed protein product [Cladocopium goreaui]|uniref:Uncharacterized protein n=1 Tax=Cladocopium goreaui TaxID=2562237 RepID=A0A9P1FVL9_9DINO|nr:unnamed protein product [Cladocopium goreaui]